MPAHARIRNITPLEPTKVAAAGPASVFIFSDHPVFRSGLSWKLDEASGIEITGESGSLPEAIEAALSASPDVIIADLRIGDGDSDGVESVKTLVESLSGVPVIAYSDFYSSSYKKRMKSAGAAAVMMKSADISQLASSIHDAIAHSRTAAELVRSAA